MLHELPKLNYDYDALEPYIDAKTMEIHHTKHHQGYVDKLNSVLDKHPDLRDKDLGKLLFDVKSLPIDESDKISILNNGGGHLNHSLFWEVMDPGNEKNEQLSSAIIEQFGSVDSMKEEFENVAINKFGSGWAWLVRDEENNFLIYGTDNQDSPYMHGYAPIIGIDVWEHAYYLKYQNRRAEYVKAWWNLVKII